MTFKKGNNYWTYLTKEQQIIAKRKLSKRMQHSPTAFKKGTNSWNFLTEKEKKKRKEKLSKIMTKYNPMKNKVTAMRRSYAERRRRGATGLLTHSERRRLLTDSTGCLICNVKFPLTIHHKNGNRFNNKKDNLLIVCFNCHYLIHNIGKKYCANKNNIMGDDKYVRKLNKFNAFL